MAGTFYGYRELDIPLHPHKRLPPRASPIPPKLSAPFMERLGISGYDYSAQNGMAFSNYPIEWTALPWVCRSAKWSVKGGPIEAQFSYDGSTVGDTRVIRGSTMTLDSFRLYKVRELVPGFHAWYQLVATL